MATSERAAYHAQNLRNASSLKGLRRVNWFSGWGLECGDDKSRPSMPGRLVRSRFLVSVRGEACVGFRVEERVVRVHSVDFARREISPLVAFVSRQE